MRHGEQIVVTLVQVSAEEARRYTANRGGDNQSSSHGPAEPVTMPSIPQAW